MTSDEAIGTVERLRPEWRLDEELEPSSTELAYVPCKRDPQAPVELCIAWIVTLTCSWGFVRVDIEDASGQVLNIVRSA